MGSSLQIWTFFNAIFRLQLNQSLIKSLNYLM